MISEYTDMVSLMSLVGPIVLPSIESWGVKDAKPFLPEWNIPSDKLFDFVCHVVVDMLDDVIYCLAVCKISIAEVGMFCQDWS